MIADSLLQPLIGGGEVTSHTHPHTVTNDQRQRMQQLEKVEFISSNYLATRDSDYIFVDSTSGVITVTLPEARGGQHVVISRVAGANNVNVIPSGTDTINGAASLVISTTGSPARLKAIVALGYLNI